MAILFDFIWRLQTARAPGEWPDPKSARYRGAVCMSDETYRISVVIPTYQRCASLQRAKTGTQASY